MAIKIPFTDIVCQTLIDALHHHAENNSNKIAFRFLPDDSNEVYSITYAELEQRAKALAVQLQKNYKSGDRAVLLFEPGLDLIEAFFGCVYAGLIAILANPPLNRRAISKLQLILENAQPVCLISTKKNQNKLLSLGLLENKFEHLADAWLLTEQTDISKANGWEYPAIDNNSIAFLQYTSGSTDKPKGVMVTHTNILHNMSLIFTAAGLHQQSVIASWLPPYHDMGLIDGILVPLYAGLLGILMSPASFLQNPFRWLKCISDYQVTATGGPNFGYDYCCKKITDEQKIQLDLSSWQVAFNGAEPIYTKTLDEFYQSFKTRGFRKEAFFPCYGLAEATLFVSGAKALQGYETINLNKTALENKSIEINTNETNNNYSLVSSGYLGQSVKIIDIETQQECPANKIGEIWVSSPSITLGYWNNAATTKNTFRNYLKNQPNQAYLRTGDLGFVHQENLYVTGRLKDLIIIRGRNLYPQDIETAVAESHPALIAQGGSAFTIETDAGEELIVVQEIKKHQNNFEEIINAVVQKIIHDFEISPTEVVLIQAVSLPKTTSGKVQRNLCREQFIKGKLKIVHKWHKPVMAEVINLPANYFVKKPDSSKAIQDVLVQWIATAIGTTVTAINTQQSFAFYGLDSVKAVQLTNDLSDWLQLYIHPAVLWEHPNITGLSDYLAQQCGLEEIANEKNKHAIDSSDTFQSDQSEQSGVFKHEAIAIIGMSCRFPGDANTPEAFWQVLMQQIDGIQNTQERWHLVGYDSVDNQNNPTINHAGLIKNIDQFDAAFFSISPREAENLDPQQRLLLELTWEALENAAIDATQLKASKTAIFTGISTSDYGALLQRQINLNELNAYLGTGTALAASAGRLAYFLGTRGQAMAIDTACSSSLVAVHNACQDLWEHDCDLAIAGGVNLILSPVESLVFAQANMLSPDGRCKTFDASANGYVRSEGCGVVILKRLSDAQRDGDRILAVIKSTAVNQDGASNGFTAPSGEAQVVLMQEALQKAHLSPIDIDYIEAHGTGTSLGDPIEMRSIAQVFHHERDDEKKLIVGSVKSNVGHLESAAGMAGLFKVILALQQKVIPANLHLKKINPLVDIESIPAMIPTENLSWKNNDKPRRAGINSFGFTGTNAHLVVEEAPQLTPLKNITERTHHLFTLSAKTEQALTDYIHSYQNYLKNNDNLKIENIAYTANTGRSHFEYRLAIVAKDKEELVGKLSQTALDIHKSHFNQSTKIAFLFTGQGSQYSGMGKVLYDTQPVFKQYFDECAELLTAYLDKPLTEIVFNSENAELLNQTGYTQPALFAIEYALAQLWMSWNIQPVAVIGHSVGEYVAATIANIMSLADGIKLIAARARLMQALPKGGAMAAINLNHQRVLEKIKTYAFENEINIAAVNAPEQTVISGNQLSIEKFIKTCEEEKIKAQQLTVSHAFHSYLMEPMLEEFRTIAASIHYEKPDKLFISNLTGAQENVITANYWVEHVRAAVQFQTGIKTIQAQHCNVLIEIGPQPVLTSMGKRCWPENETAVLWLPTLRQHKNDWEQILDSVATLYLQGHSVDWQAFDKMYQREKINLPTYPFQRQRYWLSQVKTINQPVSASLATVNKHPFLISQIRSPHIEATLYSAEVNSTWPDFINDHKVYNKITLAAAAYISTFLTGINEITQQNIYQLNKLEFIEPAIFTENKHYQLQTIFHPVKDNQGKFEFFSSEIVEKEMTITWTLHARGNWNQTIAESDLNQNETLALIQQRCLKEYAAEVLYQRLQTLSLSLTGHFRWLEKIWINHNEVLGKLRTTEDPSEINGYVLYPGLIDSLFVSVMGLFIEKDEPHRLYVPFSIESLSYDARLGQPMWVHAVKTHADTHTVSADLWLYNDQGKMVGYIKNSLFKAVSHSVFLQKVQAKEKPGCYAIHWREKPLVTTEEKKFTAEGVWIMFADNSEFSATLQNRLLQQSQQVIQVKYQPENKNSNWKKISSDSYCLSELSKIAINQLLTEIKQQNKIAGIIYAWSYAQPTKIDLTLDDLKTMQYESIGGLLFLLQAVTADRSNKIPSIWLVTQNTQSLNEIDKIDLPQSAMMGLRKSALLEHPDITCIHVDLDDETTIDIHAEQVLAELTQPKTEDQIAYRQGLRFVPRLLETTLSEQPGTKLKAITPAGCYLITGGLGSLGLLFAEWLIQQGASHLVLLSRHLPNQHVEEKLNHWRNKNIGIEVVSIDIADSNLVNRLFERFGKDLPELKGIVHAAGIRIDSSLATQNWQQFEAVFAAKVWGGWNLHQAVQQHQQNLDFFVLFSSVSSVLGSPGQTNYAAANAFLDGLAHYRRELGLPVTAINWGPWAQIGMAAELINQLEIKGISALQPEQGLWAFTQILLLHHLNTRCIIANINKPNLLNSFGKSSLLAEWDIEQSTDKLKVEMTPELMRKKLSDLANNAERQDYLINYLKELIATILRTKADAISADKSLNALGLDSLMAVELDTQLAQQLDYNFPMELVFSGITTHKLAQLINQHFSNSLISSEATTSKTITI